MYCLPFRTRNRLGLWAQVYSLTSIIFVQYANNLVSEVMTKHTPSSGSGAARLPVARFDGFVGGGATSTWTSWLASSTPSYIKCTQQWHFQWKFSGILPGNCTVTKQLSSRVVFNFGFELPPTLTPLDCSSVVKLLNFAVDSTPTLMQNMN